MYLGQEIVEKAFAMYGRWLDKWGDELEDVSEVDKTRVYAYMLDGISLDTAKMMVESENKTATATDCPT